MADHHIQLGKAGETFARKHLERRGYTILTMDYATRFAQIDIVAKDKNVLCFIEVKTRSSLKKGLPKEALTPAKQKKIIMGAQAWLKENQTDPCRIRFDVVEVIGTNEQFDVHLIQNAFQAQI